MAKVSLELEDLTLEEASAVMALLSGEVAEEDAPAKGKASKGKASKKAAPPVDDDDDDDDLDDDDDDLDDDEDDDDDDWDDDDDDDDEDDDDDDDEDELTAEDIDAMELKELKALAAENKVKIKKGTKTPGYKKALKAALL